MTQEKEPVKILYLNDEFLLEYPEYLESIMLGKNLQNYEFWKYKLNAAKIYKDLEEKRIQKEKDENVR